MRQRHPRYAPRRSHPRAARAAQASAAPAPLPRDAGIRTPTPPPAQRQVGRDHRVRDRVVCCAYAPPVSQVQRCVSPGFVPLARLRWASRAPTCSLAFGVRSLGDVHRTGGHHTLRSVRGSRQISCPSGSSRTWNVGEIVARLGSAGTWRSSAARVVATSAKPRLRVYPTSPRGLRVCERASGRGWNPPALSNRFAWCR